MTDNERDLLYLKNWINRILDDTACPLIPKACIFGNGGGDIRPHRVKFIQSLADRGVLRILAEPSQLSDEAPYVEMLSYIDRKSAIPGFLESSPINPQ